MNVYGIKRGYTGLMEEDIKEMKASDVSDTIEKGGTVLGTARCKEMRTPEGIARAVEVCHKYGIEGLVVIGGDGSYRGAEKLANEGINVVGVPGTIDLDIACTEYTIGFDTAVNTAMEAILPMRDAPLSRSWAVMPATSLCGAASRTARKMFFFRSAMITMSRS